MKRISLIILGMVAILTIAAGYSDVAGSYIDILKGGKPVVRYMYAFDKSNNDRKHETFKVFHHVMNEEGTSPITKGPRGLFTHHRGFYIGWNKLQHAGSEHDLWHMRKDEAQVHRDILVNKANAKRSILSTRIDWLGTDGVTVVLEEIRTITVYHDDPKAHAVIDFRSELKAVNGDVELRGDAEHAGMHYRAAQDVAENKSAVYIFHAQNINPKEDADLPWVTMTYQMGNGELYSVQHMNHHKNPKNTYYSAYRDYGRFGAFFEETVRDGNTLTVNYRLRITRGEAPSREVMAAQYKKYLDLKIKRQKR
jgi:hypothetical protein